MSNEHIGKSGLSWTDPGVWCCDTHSSDSKGRVVYIDGYYCTECLMDAVIDGSVKIQVNEDECSNCGSSREGDESIYCQGCYESAADSPNACDNCGDDDVSVYCSECASEYWLEAPECDICMSTAGYHQCEEHMLACRECGGTDGDTFICSDCEAQSLTKAAQPVTTDGASIEFDDGIVIQF